MQSDHYMKAVLTVIAVCLVWICVRDVAVVKPAYASGTMDVNIVGVSYGVIGLNSGTVAVRVTNWP